MPKTLGEIVRAFINNYKWVNEKGRKTKKKKRKATARTGRKVVRRKK
jgi:hypothetical protein